MAITLLHCTFPWKDVLSEHTIMILMSLTVRKTLNTYLLTSSMSPRISESAKYLKRKLNNLP